jgi:hypothetical protein
MLALLAAVMAPVLTAFGIIYRDGITSRNAQIADLIGQRDDALDQLRTANPVLDEAKSAVRGHIDRKRRE